MSEWISVDERLTDNSAVVIISLAGKTVTFGQYIHGLELWRQGDGTKARFNLPNGLVTHWQPMPDPPARAQKHY